jgi:predicted AAA+ superfamily ATPase
LDYRARVVDRELVELLAGVPAVSVEGPRAVGKTRTALRQAATSHRLDDERVRAVLAADPSLVVQGTPPVLIDEWQRMPNSWDYVRRAVDEDRTPGRFLLTGSASPAHAPTHSGAGRIVSLRMRPMCLFERAVERPTVSLAALLTGRRGPIGGETRVDARRYAFEIVSSGLPGLQGHSGRHVRAEIDSYIELALERDIEDSGRTIRSREALRRWLRAYAAASSQTTSLEKIRDAASTMSEGTPSRLTAARYLDALQATWLIEPVPGWVPTPNELRRLTTSPRHQVADPAIAARLLGLSADALLAGAPAGPFTARASTAFGALFESLVTLSVRVFAQASEARVYHLRTKGGEHEIDLIVEGVARRIVAIEVKLASTVDDADVRHLRWLQQQVGRDLLDAVVVTTGPYAYRRPDGIAVVPAALLGP